MPSIYIGAELREIVSERRKKLERERKKENDGDDVYVSEADALTTLLADDVQEQLPD